MRLRPSMRSGTYGPNKVMMRVALVVAIVATLAVLLFAQATTNVTGTIIDPNGNPYSNGTISAYTGSGPISYNGTMNSAGSFALPVVSGQSYLFTACATPVSLGPLGNTAPKQVCFTSPVIPISGTSQDVSAQMNAVSAVIGPAFGAGGLTGTVSGLSVTVSPAPPGLQFGQVQNNTTSPPQIATITNNGSQAVVVSSASFGLGSASKFGSTAIGACNRALAPNGGSCSLLITYTPTGAGTDTDSLNFTTNVPNDPLSPQSVILTGSGTPNPTSQISFTGAGNGIGQIIDTLNTGINANFNNGQCTGVCQFNYQNGTQVNFQANFSGSNTFVGFTGGGLSSSPANFTITNSQAIVATFSTTVADQTLTLLATGQGGGTLTTAAQADNGLGGLNCIAASGQIASGGGSGCNGPFTFGQIVTVTAVPNATSVAAGWLGAPAGTCSLTDATIPCTVTMNANITLTVNFIPNASTAQISLQQASTNCTVAGTTIACPMNSAQLAGDTNVCAIAFPDNTTTVTGVADSGGNTYTQFPTISPASLSGLTQSLWYSQNILGAAPGVRTITSTLSTSAATSLVGTHLYSNHVAGASTTFTTGSVTMANNNLILITTWAQLSTGPGAVSTITGGGLTWVKVNTVTYDGATTISETWRAMGTGSSGAITVTWANSPTGRGATVDEFSGVNTGGTNGSAAVNAANSPTNTGNSGTGSVTMGTFLSAGNGTYQAVGSGAGATRTAGTGMTMFATNDGEIAAAWAAGNVSPAQQTFASEQWGAIGLEIVAASSQTRRDMRCLEYAGVKQSGNPVDQSNSATGTSAAPASGALTATTGANDLLLGFTASLSSVSAVSSGMTQRVKNSVGDDGEDIEGVPAGNTNNFKPTLSASAAWVVQQVALLPQSTVTPTVFSVSLGIIGTGGGTVQGNAGTPLINASSSTPPGSCNGSCSSQVTAGSSITLTAFPNPGSVVKGWTGVTGCGPSAQCTIPNLTANQSPVVEFDINNGLQQFWVNGSSTLGGPGNDNNNGLTLATAWRTLKHASSAVTIGTTGSQINVVPFNYNEIVTLPKGGTSASAYLTWVCTTPFVVGGQNCLTTEFDTYGVNFTQIGAMPKLGFEITNPGGQVGINNNGNFCCGNQNHFLGNYIHDVASLSGCASSGGILVGKHGNVTQQTGIQVVGNLIDHMGVFPGPTCATMQGIYMDSAGGLIQDNIVTRVIGGGAQVYDAACKEIVSNNDFMNNTVGLIIYGNNGCTPGLSTVSNNVIANNSQWGVDIECCGNPDASSSPGLPTLFTNNDFFNNGTNFSVALGPNTTNTNTFSENPTASFVHYTGDATGNYQLLPTSVLVNNGSTRCVAGGTSPCTPTIDFLGVGRPAQQAIDIGALELPATVSDSFNTGVLNSALWTIDTGSCPAEPSMTCTFFTNNVDLSLGVLSLRLTETSGASAVSTGAEVRSTAAYGFGTYSCTMRASSTAVNSNAAGNEVSGSVSSCFSFINNSQTEIDSPEFEGQGSPGTLGNCTVGQVCAEFTNFNGVTHSTNNDTPVATGDSAFHTYTWNWTSASIIYQVDGVTKFTVTTNVPQTPAFVIFNHYGTNSASFGGVATSGNRWQYISNFTYTAHN